MGYIYKITNTVTKKCYIGETTENDPQKRWNAHIHTMKNIDKFEQFNEKSSEKWIQKAISHPGALRKKLGKKGEEKISKGEIQDELSKLKKKDKDPKKSGIQGLSKKDLTKLRQLNLAKTLKGLKENVEVESDLDNYMFFYSKKELGPHNIVT
jgi:hypothetical protein